LGVKPEILVGIFIERSLEMIIGLLGILKAGGAYLPLDPAYPTARIEFMLEDAQTTTLLIQAKLIERLPLCKARVLHLDTDWPIISQCSNVNLPNIAQPNNLAYVIYTSGSTGKPKGVEIIHHGLANYLCWGIEYYQVKTGFGAPVYSPLGFDATITSLFLPLLGGGQILLLESKKEVEAIKTAIYYSSDWSFIKLTPANLDMLSKLLFEKKLLRKVNFVILGGEALFNSNLLSWLSNDTKIVNEYGPTETVVGSCVYILETNTNKHTPIPIGRPIANTQIYILDRQLLPVPIGTPGELHIGGAGLARGYLNRPELTAEKFIPNPFSEEPNSRLYKTGDLARYLPDGNIEYLGRIDHQVKIRGFRIELGEIEAVLMQYHNVKEAVVIAKQEKNDKRLAAYIVSDLTIDRTPYQTECLIKIEQKQYILQTNDLSCNGISISGISCSVGKKLRINLPEQTDWLNGEVVWCEEEQIGIELKLNTSERDVMKNICNSVAKETGLLAVLQRSLASNLRKHVKEKLPDYMMPGTFILLDSIPLTPNGKIDRQALAKLSVDGKQLFTKEFVAPRTPEEKLLANIWKDILNAKRVGIEDNFFELGGHSLLVMQLISKIRDTFGVDIPLKQIFDAPTVNGMIEVINGIRTSQPEKKFDLDAEAVLDPSIQPATLPIAKSIDSIFLTGATGFLGSYLLYELLVQTTADIYCLVRSNDKDILVNKLKTNMSWNETFKTRIILVHGDLSKPSFGLKKDNFEQLANKIDIIYHNGAWVNFVYPYSALKTINVLGTQEIIKLATTIQAKRINFISTINTIDGSNGGYAQSKKVAENLIKQVRKRGLPVKIYRPPMITPHSKTGTFNHGDVFSSILKGCIQLGKIPILESVILNMVPVNYVSDTIVKLSLQQHQNKDFNLINHANLNDLFTKMSSLGYVLERIPYEQWRNELSDQTENVLYPMLPALPEEEKLSTMHSIPNKYKPEEFTGTDWPMIDDKMMDIYFTHFIESGFIDKPKNEKLSQDDHSSQKSFSKNLK
ncbi:amino acid adenylation domain-containing protein, partial [Thiotrichales bacterium HSG1]|nr:amino acid adenylation domain-containing protein [Thiotrichales bacterium HSG1]